MLGCFWMIVYMVLEHTTALGHAHLTQLIHMVCMRVRAKEVRPKTRAQKKRETIVQQLEELVAYVHVLRRSGRIHARDDTTHPGIVLTK